MFMFVYMYIYPCLYVCFMLSTLSGYKRALINKVISMPYQRILYWYKRKNVYTVVVYRSSETSINQSDVIIRSDDRFLNLVVDSDSIVSNIYMLNFVLWLLFFFCLHTDKNIVLVLSQLGFFLPSY